MSKPKVHLIKVSHDAKRHGDPVATFDHYRSEVLELIDEGVKAFYEGHKIEHYDNAKGRKYLSTYAELEQCFTKLEQYFTTLPTKEHDIVFFYYFGHGKRSAPITTVHYGLHASLPALTLDLSGADTPSEAAKIQSSSIRGYLLSCELTKWLVGIVRKQVTVVQIIDSCYAGAFTKRSASADLSLGSQAFEGPIDAARQRRIIEDVHAQKWSRVWDDAAQICYLFATNSLAKTSPALASHLREALTKRKGNIRAFGDLVLDVRSKLEDATFSGPLDRALGAARRPQTANDDAPPSPKGVPVRDGDGDGEDADPASTEDGFDQDAGGEGASQLDKPSANPVPDGPDGCRLDYTSAGAVLNIQTSYKGIYANVTIHDGDPTNARLVNQWEPLGIPLEPNTVTTIGRHWLAPERALITRDLDEPTTYHVKVELTQGAKPYCPNATFDQSARVIPYDRHLAQWQRKAQEAEYWPRDQVWTFEIDASRLPLDPSRFDEAIVPPIYNDGDLSKVRSAFPYFADQLDRVDTAIIALHTERTGDLSLSVIGPRDPQASTSRKVIERRLLQNQLRQLQKLSVRPGERRFQDWHADAADQLSRWLGRDALHTLLPSTRTTIIEVWVEDSRGLRAFHDAPWELLQHKGASVLFEAISQREIVRRVFRATSYRRVPRRDSRILRVMLFCGETETDRPEGASPPSDAKLEDIVAREEEVIVQVGLATKKIALNIEAEATLEGLAAQLQGLHEQSIPPDVLHISCHGVPDFTPDSPGWGAVISSRPSAHDSWPPSKDSTALTLLTLSQLERPYALRDTIVFLSACGSTAGGSSEWAVTASNLIAAGADAVVGYADVVTDHASALFAQVFYEMLARGESVVEAVRHGRSKLHGARPSEWSLPRLYVAPKMGNRRYAEAEPDATKLSSCSGELWVESCDANTSSVRGGPVPNALWPGRSRAPYCPVWQSRDAVDRKTLQWCAQLIRQGREKGGFMLCASDLLGPEVPHRAFADRLGWALSDFDTKIVDGAKFRSDDILKLMELDTAAYPRPLGERSGLGRRYDPYDLVAQLSGQRKKLILWTNFDDCMEDGFLKKRTFSRVDTLLDVIRRSRTARALLFVKGPIKEFGHGFSDGELAKKAYPLVAKPVPPPQSDASAVASEPEDT